MTILVTGVAGSIGRHVATVMLSPGDTFIGVDDLNDYYDPDLKRRRLAQIAEHPRFAFHQIELGVPRFVEWYRSFNRV